MDTPQYIPERPKDVKYRTLIVLLDGTGDSEDEDPTNVAILRKILYNWEGDNGNSKQLVRYFEGIGADLTKDYTALIKNKFDRAVASSFETHIIKAYKWLAENYRDHDRICIFGFSRGAYSARALAGMLNAMGLSDPAFTENAYELYEKHSRLNEVPEKREAEFTTLFNVWGEFKTAPKHKVKKPLVEFLGCWDSVNSVGMVDPIKLAYTATNGIVRTLRHAVALDERRAKFKQNMWSRPKNQLPGADAAPNGANANGPSVTTDVQEVWFAGCHCDVGGGSVLKGTRPNLSHIPMRWMIRECFKARTGIIFSATEVAKLGIEPSHLYPEVRPRPHVDAVSAQGGQTIPVIEAMGWGPWAKSFLPGKKQPKPEGKELTLPNKTEEELDRDDALAPLYDQLVLKSAMWQLLETLATKQSVYDAATSTFTTIRQPHHGAGRSIPPAASTHGRKIRVHRTVQMRMAGTYGNGAERDKQYVPKATVWQGKWEHKIPFEEAQDQIEWVS
ncbi:hypothetical protein B0H16DRAFT_1772894 [Mycena metata]|uniref:T6SS Phospholipase effector Tle1-like catalytic domain-containing protein n=1 Tax=Mycena metata TaxID=1033252 RepID=A0AAD7HYZ8_9AGAR|nr:hypothetical protein B0H16DRAFT_1772894 [Mycena metata]